MLLFLINWELSDAALIDKLNFKDNSDSDHSSINSEPLFIQNWKQLHREPPIKTIRAERRRNSMITEHTLRQKLDNFNDSRTDYWEMVCKPPLKPLQPPTNPLVLSKLSRNC